MIVEGIGVFEGATGSGTSSFKAAGDTTVEAFGNDYVAIAPSETRPEKSGTEWRVRLSSAFCRVGARGVEVK